MAILEVNQNLCTLCGQCVAECPVGLIRIQDRSVREIPVAEAACIACGHCVAVCPTAALDNKKSPLALQTPLSGNPLGVEEALQFLRRRRSIRNYQEKPVPRELIVPILDAARFAPTGGNSQGVSYLVIQNKELLELVTRKVIDWMEEQIAAQSPWSMVYEGMVRRYRKTGDDVILRRAPVLILALCDERLGLGRDNAVSALTYAELMAPSLGLGSCWAGFVELCLMRGKTDLGKLLGVSEGKGVRAALMLGFPRFTYQRLVERSALNIDWKD